MTRPAPLRLQLHGRYYRRASVAYQQVRQELGELADAATTDLREHRGAPARPEWEQRLRQRHEALVTQFREQLSDREQDSLAGYLRDRLLALPAAADVPASSGIGVEQHRPEAVQRRTPAPEFPPLRVRINT